MASNIIVQRALAVKELTEGQLIFCGEVHVYIVSDKIVVSKNKSQMAKSSNKL
jgi:hypothetical protein